MTLGDLDGDGDLDAVVANASAQAETVWLNDGSGSFTAHLTTPSFGAQESRAMALGDLTATATSTPLSPTPSASPRRCG